MRNESRDEAEKKEEQLGRARSEILLRKPLFAAIGKEKKIG